MSNFVTNFKARMEMARQDPALKYAWRPLKYDALDGAREIGQGVSVLCLALTCYLSLPGPWLMPLRIGLTVLLFLCGVLAPSAVPRLIKKHITWPRTGYVDIRKGFPFSWKGRLLILVVCTVTSMILVRVLMPEIVAYNSTTLRTVSPPKVNAATPELQQFIRAVRSSSAPTEHPAAIPAGSLKEKLLVIGWGICCAFMYAQTAALTFRQHPWKVFIPFLTILVTLGAVVLFDGGFMEHMRPSMLIIGVVWFASGIITLRQYLQHNPLPAS